MDITDKHQMYRMLSRGIFGNTTKQWFSVEDWLREAPFAEFWGIRTLAIGGPCRLMCPLGEVVETATSDEFAAAGVNISGMIDTITNVTLWAEVYDSDTGLLVYAMEGPPKASSWRQWMPTHGKHYEGLAAQMLLKKHLWPASYDDIMSLRDLYPGHVYEFSACEDAVGVIPDRNAIMWEVRKY